MNITSFTTGFSSQEWFEETRKHEQQYDEWISLLNHRLENVPEGRLKIETPSGSPQYYHCVGDKKIYLKVSQKELAEALAQKAYDQKCLRVLENWKKHVEQIDQWSAEQTLLGVYEAMSPERRVLVEPLVLPVEEMARRWAAEPYEPKEFRPGDPEHYAKNGLRVRSKSERDAVDEMLDFALYFKYECPLFLKGLGLIHPDFMVMNKRTGQIWIWEHFGKVDDRAYAQAMVKRIEAYHYNGYFEGKNLIYTMESYQQPFNRKEARRIIQQYLL